MMCKQDKKKKRIYRLPPIPAYDIEGTESWLESMAKQGWFLSGSGFFAGVAIFEKGEPKAIRYRLDAAPKSTGVWSDGGGEPDEEARAISEALGWKYVASRGNFYIYSSDDPAAQEFNTDPQVQALALDLVRRRERASLVSTIIWAAIYPLCMAYGSVLMMMIALGTGLFLLGALLVTWAACRSLVQVLHLHKLQKQMRSGEPLTHKKDWRKRAVWHKAEPFLFFVLALAWGTGLFQVWSANVTEEKQQDLKTYRQELPFGTMEALIPGAEFEWDDFGLGNTIEVNSDILAPEVITLSQFGTLSLEDGTSIEGALYVDYFETLTPWMAKELAREYQVYDRHKNRRHYQTLQLPDLGVDYAAAYTAIFPTVILTEDNRMIRISFHQYSDRNTMPLEEWAVILAEEFKAHG